MGEGGAAERDGAEVSSAAPNGTAKLDKSDQDTQAAAQDAKPVIPRMEPPSVVRSASPHFFILSGPAVCGVNPEDHSTQW